jgi:pentatricopeptide repeat domain-containing protein 1
MKQCGITVNDVTYGCLVDACVKNDRLDMALELFEQMKSAGVPLNTVLLTTLIKGFARGGRIDDAMNSFILMKQHPRTYPNIITYNSLLDGLVKH